MVSFSQSKEAKFLIADPVVAHVPTHFSGRTLICGGRGVCPVCPFERPRLKTYVVAVVRRALELVELCGSLYECIELASRRASVDSLFGLVVLAERSSVRRPWVLKECTSRPDLVVQSEACPMPWMLADLYRLPTVDVAESLEAVIKRGGLAHAPLLRSTILPSLA